MRERTDRFLDLARTARSWQLVAFFLLAANVVLTVSFARLALSTRLVPYVVEVDRSGSPTLGAPIEASALPQERLIVAELHRFLWNLRAVVNDPVAQQELVTRAYALADLPLRRKLDLHFSQSQNDPRQIAQRVSRTIGGLTILPMPATEGVFELSWHEVEIDRLGFTTTRERTYRGLLTLTTVRVESAEALVENPLGLLVTDFQWTETTPT